MKKKGNRHSEDVPAMIVALVGVLVGWPCLGVVRRKDHYPPPVNFHSNSN